MERGTCQARLMVARQLVARNDRLRPTRWSSGRSRRRGRRLEAVREGRSALVARPGWRRGSRRRRWRGVAQRALPLPLRRPLNRRPLWGVACSSNPESALLLFDVVRVGRGRGCAYTMHLAGVPATAGSEAWSPTRSCRAARLCVAEGGARAPLHKSRAAPRGFTPHNPATFHRPLPLFSPSVKTRKKSNKFPVQLSLH